MSPPAATLAAAVRSGERSARSVAEEALAAVEAADGELHAFVHVMAEEARRQADAVDEAVAAGRDPGPLAGVPVALKDNLCMRGVPTTCSSRILEGWRPPYDATVVSRAAGGGGRGRGQDQHGRVRHGLVDRELLRPARPATRHDPSRVPGGSSGGSAAAVAAGMAPLALGSDTGGSIRQPAALCGVVGMKPTYGAVSRYGLVAFASSLDQIGPFAASVADAALLYEVIAGHDPADSTSLRDVPAGSGRLGAGVEGLRVGLCTDLVDGATADVTRRVRQAAEALSAAGASVEEVAVPELRYGLSAYYLIAPAEASSNLARYDGVRYGLRVAAADVAAMNTATRTAGFGDEVKRRIMLGTYALSAGYYDAYYAQAQRVRTVVIEAFSRAYERVDVLLGATTPTTAFALGERVDDPMAMYASDLFTVCRTWPATRR